jgi:hypothetical protein
VDDARPTGPAPAPGHQRLLARPAAGWRRVEVIADQRNVSAVALDTGELACCHGRVFARHRTITALLEVSAFGPS